MADIDVGIGAMGGKLRGHVQAIPPFGWVGAAALVVIVWLAWHYWDQDTEDTTSWTNPEQPPLNLQQPVSGVEVGPLMARARRWPGSIPGAC